jgi:hypothetical protein
MKWTCILGGWDAVFLPIELRDPKNNYVRCAQEDPDSGYEFHHVHFSGDTCYPTFGTKPTKAMEHVFFFLMTGRLEANSF